MRYFAIFFANTTSLPYEDDLSVFLWCYSFIFPHSRLTHECPNILTLLFVFSLFLRTQKPATFPLPNYYFVLPVAKRLRLKAEGRVSEDKGFLPVLSLGVLMVVHYCCVFSKPCISLSITVRPSFHHCSNFHLCKKCCTASCLTDVLRYLSNFCFYNCVFSFFFVIHLTCVFDIEKQKKWQQVAYFIWFILQESDSKLCGTNINEGYLKVMLHFTIFGCEMEHNTTQQRI